MHSTLPYDYISQMRNMLKSESCDFFRSFSDKSCFGIRINNYKTDTSSFKDISPFDISPVPWIDNGFYYSPEADRPAKDVFYHAGLYYIQEPSAMTPANRLPVAKGMKVLDLCAAPGGKSTELAVKVGEDGLLVSNDISNSRTKALLKNLELFGTSNYIILNESAERLSEAFPLFFDRILCDAPCSGEGMFRKDSSVIKSWDKKSPEKYMTIQTGILENAYKMLKPDGFIMYSTCTYNSLEDEGVICSFLDNHDDLQVCPVSDYPGFDKRSLSFCDSYGMYKRRGVGNCIRILPHKMKGEGHFLALIHKRKDEFEENRNIISERRYSTGKYSKNGGRYNSVRNITYAELTDFFKDIDIDFDLSRIVFHKTGAYYMPRHISDELLKGLRVIRSGLYLGECVKKRFVPSQALAMHLSSASYKKCINFSRDDINCVKYLKGETLICDDCPYEGYILVCVCGYPLGWAKKNGNILKNKYHAGWRLT